MWEKIMRNIKVAFSVFMAVLRDAVCVCLCQWKLTLLVTAITTLAISMTGWVFFPQDHFRTHWSLMDILGVIFIAVVFVNFVTLVVDVFKLFYGDFFTYIEGLWRYYSLSLNERE